MQAVNHDEKGDRFDVDVSLDAAQADDFDALFVRRGAEHWSAGAHLSPFFFGEAVGILLLSS